ncbi:50S ribosomal protein L29 [Truepera radiovictrix]|uniref:Large ribosomal subunit protein uL29 n=1 Tax=Truepera radiovictrix (strain DSM 17093 / CIP 108686 / LMG 22925 / RQ-24) TaxID=649638 RepID=D7CVE5_TRURR|nr:50S ribosomal protein L29 [Truepera radiovictrix]ADI14173.1 ribosomal protein L29 [Truepera radiovictrix DSM 17093]WMT57267.1 50S ribosomal protein L29 [Truepera radiovictrix]
MKPSEVRNLSLDEIRSEIDKRRKELLELRFQASVGQATNPKRIGAAKREIARLLTIATEKGGRL